MFSNGINRTGKLEHQRCCDRRMRKFVVSTGSHDTVPLSVPNIHRRLGIWIIRNDSN